MKQIGMRLRPDPLKSKPDMDGRCNDQFGVRMADIGNSAARVIEKLPHIGVGYRLQADCLRSPAVS
jgi:hypothetical protein